MQVHLQNIPQVIRLVCSAAFLIQRQSVLSACLGHIDTSWLGLSTAISTLPRVYDQCFTVKNSDSNRPREGQFRWNGWLWQIQRKTAHHNTDNTWCTLTQSVHFSANSILHGAAKNSLSMPQYFHNAYCLLFTASVMTLLWMDMAYLRQLLHWINSASSSSSCSSCISSHIQGKEAV